MSDGDGIVLSLIAAVALNGVIGRDGDMPWTLPTDLRRFKAVTMGKPVVMGRRTFESIGRPLPGRLNIVVTRDRGWSAAGVEVRHDLASALGRAGEAAAADGAGEVFVIGGGALYAEAIGRASRLYVTHVEAAPEGDTLFPPIDPSVWRKVSEERPPRADRDTATVRFAVYERAASEQAGNPS